MRTFFVQVDQIVRIGNSLTITATDIDPTGVRLLATGQIIGGPQDGQSIHGAYELTKGQAVHFGPHVAIALSDVSDRVAALAIFALRNMEIQTVEHPKGNDQ